MKKIKKFRIWDNEQKKMVYSKYFNEMSFRNSGEPFRILSDYTQNPHILLDYSTKLMEYIGIKDKNKVEIYEGDILSIGESFPNYIITWNNYKCNFMIKNKDGIMEIFYHDIKLMSIIGNIYENPKLLEK